MRKIIVLGLLTLHGFIFGAQAQQTPKFKVGEIVLIPICRIDARFNDSDSEFVTGMYGMIKSQPYLEPDTYLVHGEGTDCSAVIKADEIAPVSPKSQKLLLKTYKYRQSTQKK